MNTNVKIIGQEPTKSGEQLLAHGEMLLQKAGHVGVNTPEFQMVVLTEALRFLARPGNSKRTRDVAAQALAQAGV